MKSTKSKTGCLSIFVIFLIFCGIVGLFQSCFGDDTEIEFKWQKDSVTVTDATYTQTLKLEVNGKYNADELDKNDIEIDVSNDTVCKVNYEDANYSYIELKVTPIKNGETDVKVKYKEYESDSASLIIDISEKDETNTTTTTPRTTTSTTTTTTPIPTTTTTTEKRHVVYLLNPESMKIHMENCRTIKHPENFQKTSDYDTAINQGYTPCGVCMR